jgi:hypothetical protein
MTFRQNHGKVALKKFNPWGVVDPSIVSQSAA